MVRMIEPETLFRSSSVLEVCLTRYARCDTQDFFYLKKDVALTIPTFDIGKVS